MKTSLRKLIWLGGLVISTVAVAVASDDGQVVIDGLMDGQSRQWRFPTFDRAEDIVDQWTEGGRQFINRNGKTCAYLRR